MKKLGWLDVGSVERFSTCVDMLRHVKMGFYPCLTGGFSAQ